MQRIALIFVLNVFSDIFWCVFLMEVCFVENMISEGNSLVSRINAFFFRMMGLHQVLFGRRVCHNMAILT